MITKKELRLQLESKEMLVKELLKIIDDKNQQIINLLTQIHGNKG